ncbi:hypothetical protein Pla52o_11190 [Novipirellula galeiformis]|uniref:Uncharacterized protein n=1 Tax=Novipirellula galeiformis TaxID=2528004 RepID=A0A5C6CPY1_9BACT|nr:hypothetical protein Pla52o_11190 [Novipirellula galeiformis]
MNEAEKFHDRIGDACNLIADEGERVAIQTLNCPAHVRKQIAMWYDIFARSPVTFTYLEAHYACSPSRLESSATPTS